MPVPLILAIVQAVVTIAAPLLMKKAVEPDHIAAAMSALALGAGGHAHAKRKAKKAAAS